MRRRILYVLLVLMACFDVSAQSGRDVEVTVFLIDIEEINNRTQSFVANVYLSSSWHDPALAHSGPGMIGMQLEDIWHPNLQILNQQRLVKTFADTAEVTPDGHITVRQRYWGGFPSPWICGIFHSILKRFS
jgi:hypothetical protein